MVLGFIIISLVIGFILFRPRTMYMRKKISLLGVMSATWLVGMNLPTKLIFPGYHINIPDVHGILIGPVLAFLAAFTANLMVPFIRPGGTTIVVFNTPLVGTDAALGHTRSCLHKRLPTFRQAVLEMVGTLLLATMMLFGFVALSSIAVNRFATLMAVSSN